MYRGTYLTRSIAALIFTLGLAPLTNAAERVPLSKSLSHANLSAYIGQSFYVYGGEKGLRKVVSLEIIGVSERKQDAKTEQFFVRFRGPSDPVLSESVYTFCGGQDQTALTAKRTRYVQPVLYGGIQFVVVSIRYDHHIPSHSSR